MGNGSKVIRLLLLFLLLFFITSCSVNNKDQLSEEDIDSQTESEPYIASDITIESLLNEFGDWEGNKESGKSMYTLNFNNDKYILTIKPNETNNYLNWVDMHYIIPLKENYDLTAEELEPMDKLAIAISGKWKTNKKWIDKALSKDLPYEENHGKYKLLIDYYIYNNNKEGLYFKISNVEGNNAFASQADTKDKFPKETDRYALELESMHNILYLHYSNLQNEYESQTELYDVDSWTVFLNEWNNKLKEYRSELDSFDITGETYSLFYVKNQLSKASGDMAVVWIYYGNVLENKDEKKSYDDLVYIIDSIEKNFAESKTILDGFQ